MHDSCMSGRGSRAWWSTVNTITGRDTQPQSISSVIHPDTINEYFCNINSDPKYIAPSLIDIPDDATIPEIPLHVVTQLLSKLKRTACGPDKLPYWPFKEFAHDLAPVVTDVFNSSLRQHKVPSSWKMADIRPLLKESPLTCCTQLRPISSTPVIMRLFFLNDWSIGLNFPVFATIILISISLPIVVAITLQWHSLNVNIHGLSGLMVTPILSEFFPLTLVRPLIAYHTISYVVN